MVKKTEVTEIYQGTHVCFNKVILSWDILRIGGSVLDVKKWIESGTPVDVMSTLNSIVAGNSSATNIQKLFAGMMFIIMLTVCLRIIFTCAASQLQYAAMQLKQGPPVTAAVATTECEDESLLYLLDCLMMLYSAAVHRVLREVKYPVHLTVR